MSIKECDACGSNSQIKTREFTYLTQCKSVAHVYTNLCSDCDWGTSHVKDCDVCLQQAKQRPRPILLNADDAEVYYACGKCIKNPESKSMFENSIVLRQTI